MWIRERKINCRLLFIIPLVSWGAETSSESQLRRLIKKTEIWCWASTTNGAVVFPNTWERSEKDRSIGGFFMWCWTNLNNCCIFFRSINLCLQFTSIAKNSFVSPVFAGLWLVSFVFEKYYKVSSMLLRSSKKGFEICQNLSSYPLSLSVEKWNSIEGVDQYHKMAMQLIYAE